MEPKGLFFAPTEMIERCAIIMLPVRHLLLRLLVFGSAGRPVSDGLCGWRLTCGMTADNTLLPSQPATAVASAAQPAAIPASRRSQGGPPGAVPLTFLAFSRRYAVQTRLSSRAVSLWHRSNTAISPSAQQRRHYYVV
eukprot:COSAG03_NODE_1033_length_4987_cov_24.234247_3_plen_138_part_00